jgi:hypothetical protein
VLAGKRFGIWGKAGKSKGHLYLNKSTGIWSTVAFYPEGLKLVDNSNEN